MNRLKRGDKAVVISGQHKGLTGEITAVDVDGLRVTLDTLTMSKHRKPTANIEGGIITIPRPIHASNVALLEPSEGKASKIKYVVGADGKKMRVFKKTDKPVDELV